MRIESSVTSVSWLPLGAVQALPELAFASGVDHYDPPPPDQLHDPGGLLARGGARFVNQLRAFIEVQDGRITAHGHLGQGHIGSTTLRLASTALTFPGAAFPDLRPRPQVGRGWVRFARRPRAAASACLCPTWCAAGRLCSWPRRRCGRPWR
jgi:hypothetical protein